METWLAKQPKRVAGMGPGMVPPSYVGKGTNTLAGMVPPSYVGTGTNTLAGTTGKAKTSTPVAVGETAAEKAAREERERLAALLAAQQNQSKGLSYNYSPATQPAYAPQAYNVNLPQIDWSFNPTEQQRGGWNTQATATAAQEIDPQLQAIAAALQQYMTQGQNQRNELNPRYTGQSLSIANIIQNSVKQEAINNAIRRGAEQSGWLPSALMEAGKTEASMRGDIESQRNQDLNALAALEGQQTQAAGAQGTMLEGLRGKRITTALADLENQAWARAQQEKESQWGSALGGEQLRASAYGANASNQLAAYQTQAQVGQSEADRALQAAVAQSNQANTQWNQQYTTSQDAYQRQLQAANAARSGIGSNQPTMIDTPYGKVTVAQAQAMGYLKPGPYSGTGESALDKAIREALGG